MGFSINKFCYFGLAGVMIIALSFAYLIFLVMPLQGDLNKPRFSLASKNFDVSGVGSLASFYGTFPKASHLSDLLTSLNYSATGEGLIIEQGEYHLIPPAADKLTRYEMTLPVRGDYPHLRSFLSKLMVEWPTLALNSVKTTIPAIVDANQYEQVRKLRESRAPDASLIPPKSLASPLILAGVIKCRCGRAMTLATGKGGQYRYYKCTRKRNEGGHACDSRNLPMEKVDQIVIDYLANT